MPPLRSKPVCGKCGAGHWNFVPCDQKDEVEQREIRNEQQRRGFIKVRPREGYIEFGNKLDPDTVLMGSTFAIKRAPGERHGGYRG